MAPVQTASEEQVIALFFDLPHVRKAFAVHHPGAALPEALRGRDANAALRSFLHNADYWNIDASPLFDWAHYLERNPDVAAAGVPAFAHFLRNGFAEGRAFHPEVILPSGPGGPVHLGGIGDLLERGSYRFGPVPEAGPARLALAGALLAAAGGDAVVAGRLVELLAQLVDDEVAQIAYPGLEGWALVAQLLSGERDTPVPGVHFGGPVGTSGVEGPGPSPSLSAAAAMTVEGIPRCWSPGPRMNMHYYEQANPDLERWPHDLLSHYLAHGQFEWRRAGAMIDPDWLRRSAPDSHEMPAMKALQLAALRGERLRPNSACLSPVELIELIEGRIDAFAAIDIIARAYDEALAASGCAAQEHPVLRQMRAASALDPRIQPIQPHRTLLPKPFDLPLLPAAAAARRGIGPCDIIVLRDHVSMGGADRVAGAALRALRARDPQLRVVVLSTMADGLGEERMHYPDDTLIFDFGAFSETLDPQQMQELLYDVIAGSGCRAVLNVNSRLGWETLLAFGRQLRQSTRLVGYMFCDDRDVWGNVDGYPARYFLPAMEHLDALITDTDDLRAELCERVAGAESLTRRLHWLRTPFTPSNAETATVSANGQLRVVWAGRFDRQKRFGLMVEIAREMPDAEFLVWGKPVLGDYQLDSDGLPENIRLMGSYAEFSEIAATAPSVFLYTSLWDGAPTILLDAVAWGLPVVATDVGGVRECLPPGYDHLIDAAAEAPAYRAAIEALAVQDPTGRKSMRDAYSAALAHRDVVSYATALRKILLP